MEYLSVAQAREQSGLRLVLTEGMPGPWAEAAKAVLNFKGIAFTPVAQKAGEANEDLEDWTGQTTAPVAVLDNEPVRYTWLDILMMAERLSPTPPLLPADLEQRALVLGLTREIAGEDGLGWNKRHLMLAPGMAMEEVPEFTARMAAKYGWSETALAGAKDRICEILTYFTERLRAQQSAGSPFVIGSAISAIDIFLANFIGMFVPLPEALNPMPAFLRNLYTERDPQICGVLDGALLSHRDRMYRDHLKTPLEF